MWGGRLVGNTKNGRLWKKPGPVLGRDVEECRHRAGVGFEHLSVRGKTETRHDLLFKFVGDIDVRAGAAVGAVGVVTWPIAGRERGDRRGCSAAGFGFLNDLLWHTRTRCAVIAAIRWRIRDVTGRDFERRVAAASPDAAMELTLLMGFRLVPGI